MADVVYILDLMDWKLSKCPVRVSRREVPHTACAIVPVLYRSQYP